MGIDGNNRDLFSRIVYGSRLSLQIGISTITFAILVGGLLGAVSGFYGGWIDNLIMRIMDVLMAFPRLLLAIAIVSVLGPGLINALLAIAIVSIPIYARVVRSSVLSVKGPGLRGCLARHGRLQRLAAFQPHPAQCPDPLDRPGHAGDCFSHSERSRVELPGPGRRTSHAPNGA